MRVQFKAKDFYKSFQLIQTFTCATMFEMLIILLVLVS